MSQPVSKLVSQSVSSPPSPTPSSARWLCQRVLAYRFLAVAAVVPLLVSTALVLVAGSILRRVVDLGLAVGDTASLTFWTCLLLALVAGLGVASWVRLYLSARLAERVVGQIRDQAAQRLLGSAPSTWSSFGGTPVSDLASDSEQLHTALVVFVPMALRHCILLIGGIALAVHTEPLLAGVLLLSLPVFLVPISLLAKRLRRAGRALDQETSVFNQHLDEAWRGVSTLRALNLTRLFEQRNQAQLGIVATKGRDHSKARANLIALALTLALAAAVAVFWLGGQAVVAGSLSAGALAAFVFYAAVVAGAAGALGEVVGDLQRGLRAAGRLAVLLSLEVEDPAHPKASPEAHPKANTSPQALEDLPPSITLEAVSFRYPDAAQLALDSVSLSLARGSFTALLGTSGAGKSTLFRLLWRLYEPDSGQILCDDKPIAELSPTAWRGRIAVVEQNPALFSMSLRDNLLLGYRARNATETGAVPSDADLCALLTRLGADSLRTRLPGGLDGHLRDGGAELSGGERQWIAIVRAVLCRPALLLLDEASAGLDALSEEAFRQVLREICNGIYGKTTLLVIAHRLSTVQAAEQVIVLESGKVIEQGRPETLAASGGAYARFLRAQSLKDSVQD